MDIVEIPTRKSKSLPLMQRVEQAYMDRFGVEPETKGGWYEPDGWKRISRVYERLQKGGMVLDVGSGAGQFVNCLALSGEFESVTTIDPTRFDKYIELSSDICRYDMSVSDMSFADNSFDVVVCMEVLEHLPDEVFVPAIDELRRVCRGQLVITVPYREPEPISKTHVRRFEDEDLLRLFPNAQFGILRRPHKPWALIEEWPNGDPWVGSSTLPREVANLRAEVGALQNDIANLRARKSLRAANWVGRKRRDLCSKVARQIKR